MCGRFVGFRRLEELQQYFPIERAACEVTANYNVAPSQQVLAIVKRDAQNWLDRFHWGLVPFWAKDQSVGNRMINARAETLAVKPSFRDAFRKRRCLILADGFYEWKGTQGRKQPMFLTLASGSPFAFAGIWETWSPPGSTQSVYPSCAIITTAASASVRAIHPRMPAILKPDVFEDWLSPSNQDAEQLARLLNDGLLTELVSHPVSTRVNSTRNNDPDNVKPLTQMPLKF
jgi:putative SOS response-associated peptidase YedK